MMYIGRCMIYLYLFYDVYIQYWPFSKCQFEMFSPALNTMSSSFQRYTYILDAGVIGDVQCVLLGHEFAA